MYKITDNTITEEILNQYIPQEIKNREKLIKNINECYQYNKITFREVSKGNYSFISKAIEYHKFINN